MFLRRYLIDDGNATETTTVHPPQAGESKAFTGHDYGSSYTYSVKACFGNGLASDTTCREQTGSLAVSVELSAPTGVALDSSVGYDGSYALSWSSVTGMASYTIEELALSDPANACPDSFR